MASADEVQTRALSMTIFKSIYSTKASKPRKVDFYSEFSSIRCDLFFEKKELPGFIFGFVGEGNSRKNSNVAYFDGGVLDIERKNMEPPEYKERLNFMFDEMLSDYEYFAYTTFSHTDDDPRMRIILPSAKRVDAQYYKDMMIFVNSLACGLADRGAQKPSQINFIPAHNGKNGQQCRFEYHAGRRFDLSKPFEQGVISIRSELGEKKGKAPFDLELRQILRNILEGQPYAERGNRDQAALKSTWFISRRLGSVNSKSLMHVYKTSTHFMDDDAPTLENILDKFERADEITESELSPVDPDTNKPQAILQRGYWYYFLKEDGDYSVPHIRAEFDLAVRTYLAKRKDMAFKKRDASGKIVEKTATDLVREYGVLSTGSIIDLQAPKTYLDKNKIIHESTIQWPNEIEPQFDEEIDQWIMLLGGEKLKDWLSLLPNLERTLSALVIMGPGGSGKTLLAMGCSARFGSETPSKQSALTSAFQEELTHCPLIHIDEDIDENPYDRKFLSAIRNELSVYERYINRKHMNPVPMKGAIRCIISANHLPFKQRDAQTGQDLQAIAERFYWINSTNEPAEYLKTIKPARLNYWRKHGIAAYIKHLEETRTVDHSNRFGVCGDSEELADLINISVRWNSWVTEWLCNGVLDRFRKLGGSPESKNGAIIYNQEVYVRVKTVVESWKRYLPNNNKDPDTRPISDALRSIAEVDTRYKPKEIGLTNVNNQFRYYKIRNNPLVAFLEQTGSATREELQEALAKGTADGIATVTLNDNVKDLRPN